MEKDIKETKNNSVEYTALHIDKVLGVKRRKIPLMPNEISIEKWQLR